MSKPTLLILAGGLASRYGGIKQMDTIGPSGEAILDYSVYDAIEAGFGKVVFVLNKAIAKEFIERYSKRFNNKIELDFVIQQIEDIPQGFQILEQRQKPWGTGHAVRAARNAINEPFVVINADDFYGKTAYQAISHFLKDSTNYGMYAYKLGNTLSEHGTVSRGVCAINGNKLTNVTENTGIKRVSPEVIISEQHSALNDKTLVSMNFWAFQPDVFPVIETLFEEFMEKNNQHLTAEFYIPSVVQHVIEHNLRPVEVLSGDSPWFGMTYKSDREETKLAVSKLISNKIYPEKLWK
ncbi:MAG: NTP transferase domain-containing protein [Salinivirgaceae bacterium]|nr:NTP transferase domain-containing protein [Salinivirgaceae bacterium]MDD4745671.1 NTP transferase domain-containing protein [Salinivirgaceae bacterium]MDY0280928.1 NTP transferase domain-containing protein [Salinivirgaceae bacterium]